MEIVSGRSDSALCGPSLAVTGGGSGVVAGEGLRGSLDDVAGLFKVGSGVLLSPFSGASVLCSCVSAGRSVPVSNRRFRVATLSAAFRWKATRLSKYSLRTLKAWTMLAAPNVNTMSVLRSSPQLRQD